MLYNEVSDLCHALESLVDGTMESDCHIRFAEPDLEFEFYTAKRLYSVPGKIIYTKGYCDVDIHLDIFINFWCMGGLDYWFDMQFPDYKEVYPVSNQVIKLVALPNHDKYSIKDSAAASL